MSILPEIMGLPVKYHVLSSIPSVELKLKLGGRLGEILKLLEFFDTVEPELKTTILLNNFFDYLNRTMNDPNLLIKRARWIVLYANVVYDHLLTVKHGPVLSRETVTSVDDSDFVKRITSLTSSITAYYSNPSTYTIFDYPTFCVIRDIVNISNRVRPDPTYPDYLIAVEKIEELTHQMVRLVLTKSVLQEDKGSLQKQLREIYFHINRFVSHKGILL